MVRVRWALLLALFATVPACHFGEAWKDLWKKDPPTAQNPVPGPSQGEQLAGSALRVAQNPADYSAWVNIAEILGTFVAGAITGKAHSRYKRRKKATTVPTPAPTPEVKPA